MSRHEIAPTSQTIEMRQIQQINERLTESREPGDLLPARDLGLAGSEVRPSHLDTVVAHRAHLPDHLSSLTPSVGTVGQDDLLVQLVAAGSPTFPYIYGLFSSRGQAQAPAPHARLLPVTLHTAQLRQISQHYHFRHRWGV